MPRTVYESGEPLPGECGQPPAKTPATAASPTIRSVAPTGDARSQSSEPEADTAIEPARRETDTCPAEQRPISVNADGGEKDAPRERERPADPFEEWKTKETRYYRQRRRDTEGRLSEWTPKLCAGAFGTTLYLGANLAGPPEWTELLGAAWTCWILGLLTWYVSGLTDIRANDTAVNNISRLTATDHNGVAAEKDVFGPWNRRTRWLARLTGFLLLTGVIFALAFAWINIGKIGGPNDHAESGSNTDNTATATPRHARTAGTDADSAAEDPSSAEPAKEMSQPDTTGRLAVYTADRRTAEGRAHAARGSLRHGTYTDETGAGQPTIQLAERPVRPRPDMNDPTATDGSQRYIDHAPAGGGWVRVDLDNGSTLVNGGPGNGWDLRNLTLAAPSVNRHQKRDHSGRHRHVTRSPTAPGTKRRDGRTSRRDRV